MKILPRNFYDRDVQIVARELLGKRLIRSIDGQQFSGIIAETEAYRSDDPASHAYRGKTNRNAALFGPVGHTYVYTCYGIHTCLNIVSRDTKKFPAGGILIRALISLDDDSLSRIDGPGRVAKMLKVESSESGIDVTRAQSSLFITEGVAVDDADIKTTGRIGISVAKEVPWRFVLKKGVLKPDLIVLRNKA